MNLILFGPPGAGKGTQSEFICNKFNLKQISTGDLLRKEIKNETSLGLEIMSTINKGNLVTDILVTKLLEKEISLKENSNRLIYDGYPRNLNQVKLLDELLKKYNQTEPIIISLNVKKDVIKKRIKGRLFCNNCQKTFNEYFNPPTKFNHNCSNSFIQRRDDDKLETLIKRFDTYLEQTTPVLTHYIKKTNFHEVNGNEDIHQISSKIETILTNLSN